jgi:hypothetical protein
MNTYKTNKTQSDEPDHETSVQLAHGCPLAPSNGRYIYSIFHTLMSFIAIYLAFRCNNGFEWGPFLVALIFPYAYIIYALATKGTCGMLENTCVATKSR